MRACSLRTRLLVLALGSAAAAATGSGCSSGTPSSAADRSFLGTVHVEAPQIASFRSDIALVRLGHAACDGFRSGASYEELADRMSLEEGSHPLPSQDLGIVISAAVQNYCPQFGSRVS